jgi:choline dehydrogenase-like flavoprotein
VGATFTADVVFVGSGVAAAVAGAKLAAAGVRVLFLEAGPRVDRGQAVDIFQHSLSKAQNSPYPDKPYAPQPDESNFGAYYVQMGPNEFRGQQARVVGGTTWHWAGLAMRFRPNDFKLRSTFGVGVDWPFGYDEMEPWYAAAEDELGVAGDDAYDWGAPRKSGYPMPRIPLSYADIVVGAAAARAGYTVAPFPQARNAVWRDGRPQCCGNAICVPICPIQAKYDGTASLAKAERAGAHVEPQAIVHQVVIGPERRVEAVRFLRPNRREGEATGRIFVLAAHAVETPKILLLSAGEGVPNGVANSSGEVGRNLLSQIDVGIQGLTAEPVFPYRGPVTTGGILELRDGPFRGEHCSLGMSPTNQGWSLATGPITLAAELIKQGLRGEALREAIRRNVSRQMIIGTAGEMLPDDYNRVELALDQADELGIPRPRIFFRYQDYTMRGLAVARQVQDAIFANLGATQVKQLGPIADSAIMGGTTRMGDDPRSSVVDADLRSHDHPNLFIVGSQVFPSITCNTPTLTVAALSARLGSYLLSELGKG